MLIWQLALQAPEQAAAVKTFATGVAAVDDFSMATSRWRLCPEAGGRRADPRDRSQLTHHGEAGEELRGGGRRLELGAAHVQPTPGQALGGHGAAVLVERRRLAALRTTSDTLQCCHLSHTHTQSYQGIVHNYEKKKAAWCYKAVLLLLRTILLL